MGTNTVGSNLGGTRYAELSIPGSVHGDETRPPFLLGHLPRLALKVWAIGTGQPNHVSEGLNILHHLEAIIERGSEAMRVIFTSADDGTIAALIGGNKKNQVQSFYQAYEVTSRAADHQWWRRNYQAVLALPTNRLEVTDPVADKCTPVIPVKIAGTTLDMILPSAVLGALVLRLLFSSDKKKPNRNKK